MYYNGSNIVVQMYIYNNTGMTVRSIEDLVIGLYDTDPDGQSWPRESVKVGKWIPSNGKLKNKAYDVITVTFNTRDDRELYVLNKKNYYYNRPEVAPGIDAGTPIVDGKATLLPAKKAGIAFEMEQ